MKQLKRDEDLLPNQSNPFAIRQALPHEEGGTHPDIFVAVGQMSIDIAQERGENEDDSTRGSCLSLRSAPCRVEPLTASACSN